MDFDKLFNLSNTVNTWASFVLEHAVTTTEYSCLLRYYKNRDKDFIFSLYKKEFYYLKKNMQDLILKYEELEKFFNENNINGV